VQAKLGELFTFPCLAPAATCPEPDGDVSPSQFSSVDIYITQGETALERALSILQQHTSWQAEVILVKPGPLLPLQFRARKALWRRNESGEGRYPTLIPPARRETMGTGDVPCTSMQGKEGFPSKPLLSTFASTSAKQIDSRKRLGRGNSDNHLPREIQEHFCRKTQHIATLLLFMVLVR